MTANELSSNVGKTGHLNTQERLSVEVEIKDAKSSFGRVQYLITPKAGTGIAWVDAARVAL